MNRRVIGLFLSVIMGMALLAGCGAGQPTEQNNPAAQDANGQQNGQQNSAGQQNQVVNVYTSRHYEIDDELFQMFTEQTGIQVNTIEGKEEELIERIKREGENTAADLFFTVDGGVLNEAKKNGILQPVESEVVEQNVPEQLRDRDNHWIGVSTRARVIVYAKNRVKPEELSTYEDLTAEKWQGKVLVRSSTSRYNQSLLASFIELYGEQKAEEWARGIVQNMARQPEGGDRDQAKAIAAGVGDVAIMNTYYLGLMLHSKDPEEVKVAEQLGVIFPNQETTGTHVNISGIGLTKHSKNKDNAIKLIEFFTSEEAQSKLSQANFEFPANPKAEMPDLLKSWGEFKAQQIDFAKLGEHNRKAIEIFQKVGWK